MDDSAGCDSALCNLVILEDCFQRRIGTGGGGVGADLMGMAGVASRVPDCPLLFHSVMSPSWVGTSSNN